MSRINSNLNSMIAQRMLVQHNASMSTTLERLSTGMRINRASDGPADLVASENFRADKAAISSAIGNAERAGQIAATADGALEELSGLLLQVQGLVDEAGADTGISADEKEANQVQIDTILQTIDRIASTTSFGATKLLNGSLDFNVSSVSGSVADYSVRGAKIAEDDTLAVKVLVTASAQHAALFLSTAGSLDLTDSDSTFTFEIAGAKGNRQFSFSSGATTSDIAAAINGFVGVTGVSAVTQGTGVMLKSTEFGSDQDISFDMVSLGGQAGAVHQVSSADEDVVSTVGSNITAFSSVTSPVSDTGQDVAAFINGVKAAGHGASVQVATDGLDIALTLTDSAATAAGSISALSITGGGATFNIGPGGTIDDQIRLGLPSVASRHLGTSADGYLNTLGSGGDNNLIDGNIEDASTVVGKAIAQINGLRGRLGGFQAVTLQSTLNNLNVALENTTAAESAIRDTDFAAEAANLTRNQILVQAATSALAIANARPQSILQLLS